MKQTWKEVRTITQVNDQSIEPIIIERNDQGLYKSFQAGKHALYSESLSALIGAKVQLSASMRKSL